MLLLCIPEDVLTYVPKERGAEGEFLPLAFLSEVQTNTFAFPPSR